MKAPSTAFAFRLYIVGDAPNSARALANLDVLRERYFRRGTRSKWST